jgi:clan AA aspartic protease (TIGR02281 family)
MRKLTLAIALLASTPAYAEPYQSNAQFRANWNNLTDKARANPSQVTHNRVPATDMDPMTDVWTFPLPGRNVTVVLFENSRWAMYCFDTGAATADCYNNVGEKNVLDNNHSTPEPVSSPSSGEFTCDSPILTVGKQDPSAVTSLKLRHNGSYWSIIYTMSDGTVYQRNEQYDISDTSTTNVQEWTGRKRTNSDITEIGDLTQNGSTFIYNERMWRGGQLTIDATASCWSTSQTIEASAPPDTGAPPSAPTSTTDSVGLRMDGNAAYISVNLGGGSQTEMLIDTGATNMALTQDAADALISTGAATMGLSGRVQMADGLWHEVETVKINRVQVGTHVVTNVRAIVSGSMLLGLGVLNRMSNRISLDMANGQLIFG